MPPSAAPSESFPHVERLDWNEATSFWARRSAVVLRDSARCAARSAATGSLEASEIALASSRSASVIRVRADVPMPPRRVAM